MAFCRHAFSSKYFDFATFSLNMGVLGGLLKLLDEKEFWRGSVGLCKTTKSLEMMEEFVMSFNF